MYNINFAPKKTDREINYNPLKISKKDVFDSSLKIDVYQSIIKNSKLELIIEKLVE